MPVKKYSQKAELKDRDLELQKMEVEFQRKNLRQGLRRGKLAGARAGVFQLYVVFLYIVK